MKKWIFWILFGLVALLLFLWPQLYPEKFYLHVGILMCLHFIGAVSLNLVMRAGLLSFAHVGFMGIGAYTSTLLVMRLGVPFPLAFLASFLMPAIVALGMGTIILRLKGVYFVLITFAMGEVIRLIFVNWTSVTGGSTGIYNVPSPEFSFGGWSYILSESVDVYYFAVCCAMVVGLACVSLARSEFGRALDTIRENDMLAEALGVNTLKYKTTAFALGAGMVGFAGSIFAHYVRYLAPIDFTWRLNLDFIAYNVVGGIASPAGPIIGTVILMPLPEFLRGAVEYQWIIYSVVIILMVRFIPDGLVSIPRRVKKLLQPGSTKTK